MKLCSKKDNDVLYQNIFLFIYAIIGILLLLNSVDWFNAVPGDVGDTRWASVILEHVYRWSVGAEAHLWDPQFFYPLNDALAFSENFLGSAIPYAALRVLGFQREIAFDGWYCLGAFLNFVSGLYVLRKLNFSPLAAGSGAFFFAFSLPIMHFQETLSVATYRWAIPLAIYNVYRFNESNRYQFLLFGIFWTVVQFLTSLYVGYFLVYFLIIMLIADSIYRARKGISDLNVVRKSISYFKYVRQLACLVKHQLFVKIICYYKNGLLQFDLKSYAALVILVIIMIYVLAHYVYARIHYGFQTGGVEIPRIWSYLIADNSQLSSFVGGWIPKKFMSEGDIRGSHNLFIGIGPLVILFFVMRALAADVRKAKLVAIMMMAFALTFITTLQISRHLSIYGLFLYIPTIATVRTITRVLLVAAFPLSVMMALSVEYLVAQQAACRKWKSFAVMVLIMVALIAEPVFYKNINASIDSWQQRRDRVLTLAQGKLQPDSILYVIDSDAAEAIFTEIDGMVVAQDLGLGTLNGDSSNFPIGFIPSVSCDGMNVKLGKMVDKKFISTDTANGIRDRIVMVSPQGCP